MLDAHGTQRLSLKTQRFQNSRCNLRSCYRCLDYSFRKARIRDDQADVGIPDTETAVFGIFLLRSRVDRAVLGLDEQVWRAIVGQWIVELERKRIAGKDVLNEQRFRIRIQVI